jgi:hypothetical protein
MRFVLGASLIAVAGAFTSPQPVAFRPATTVIEPTETLVQQGQIAHYERQSTILADGKANGEST